MLSSVYVQNETHIEPLQRAPKSIVLTRTSLEPRSRSGAILIHTLTPTVSIYFWGGRCCHPLPFQNTRGLAGVCSGT